METKKNIRKLVFQRRKEARPEDIRNHSALICKTLCSLGQYQESDWVYLYIDCKNEVMTGPVMKAALSDGKRIAAPKVIGQNMVFYEIHGMEDLEPGYFGILEPKEGLPIARGEDGLLLMPGVAFDPMRHRIGYGGGFYDRYLSIHTRMKKVAVAFEFQILKEVPFEKTDILPDLIVTESRTIG